MNESISIVKYLVIGIRKVGVAKLEVSSPLKVVNLCYRAVNLNNYYA